ncbi:MAG: hypothetical protein IBX55_12780 [Methyloprofundus sp.]|nr:hypothetical protein [Methyloprofundus sp.]
MDCILGTKPGMVIVESAYVYEWFKSQQHNNTHFNKVFIQWLQGRDESIDEPYTLAQQTMKETKLKDLLESWVEEGTDHILYCPDCESEYPLYKLNYLQTSGSHIDRLSKCPLGHTVFGYEYMRFIFGKNQKPYQKMQDTVIRPPNVKNET